MFVLFGDLGGTNCRLNLYPLTCLHNPNIAPTRQLRLKTNDLERAGGVIDGFIPALKQFINTSNICLCVLSVCGPVENGVASCSATSMGTGHTPLSRYHNTHQSHSIT